MAEEQRIYDLVILGATGFTGQFVLEEVLQESSNTSKKLKICSAGRSEEKLKSGIKLAGERCNISTEDIGIEIVDVKNDEDLKNLASKTKILMSCVGPYRMYGMPVAKACIAANTDFLDISGEPQYLEEVQATLNDSAVQKGVHLVGSCGFDSVPADLGTAYLEQKFPGELCHVEMVAGHHSIDGSSASIHATTLECAVLGYANKDKLRENRSKILSKETPMPSQKTPNRPLIWWNENSNEWCVANIGSDKSVVTRTQHLLYKLEEKKPVNFSAYFGMHSLAGALKSVFFGIIFLIMNGSNWSRNMMIKHPKIFSLGMFSWEGASRETLMKQSFVMTLTGKGWKNTGEDRPPTPDTTLVCKVSGPDPGYFGTARIFVQCAMTMLYEKEKLPSGGGVFTPGAAFRNTSLIERLNSRGIKFSISQ